ncbi:ATP-binding protein [Amycolatopsis pittospori]|uniref:ATP-binding protein n=1 Tax=Amycolatopsis pittospori TaxID=2749434 RepID=UPI002E286109|nr:ATP-binding protein [Amycolatopsis pittospori]
MPPLAPVRTWVRVRLAHLPKTTVQDAELLATELVTNAYLHAAGPRAFRLRLPADRPVIRLEVDDASPTLLPHLRDLQDGATSKPGGRGLLLVTAVATTWGVTSTPQSKTTWAEILLDRPAPEHHTRSGPASATAAPSNPPTSGENGVGPRSVGLNTARPTGDEHGDFPGPSGFSDMINPQRSRGVWKRYPWADFSGLSSWRTAQA